MTTTEAPNETPKAESEIPPNGENPTGNTTPDTVSPAPTVPPSPPPPELPRQVDASELVSGPAAAPAPGKINRSLTEWARVDWTKTNSQIAKECGVTRQAVAQARHRLRKANTTAAPSFADITGETDTEIPPGSEYEEPAAPVPMVDYNKLASMIFAMSTGLLTNVFGPEWQPRMIEQLNSPPFDEKANMEEAIANYLRSKEVKDIPPGVMLTIVCLAYAGPRLNQPSTRSKLQMFFTAAKSKIVKLFRRKSQPLPMAA